MAAPLYVHLPNGSTLPALGPAPFKVLLLAESIVTDEWRTGTCEDLVRRGCRAFIVWGQDGRQWRDAMSQSAGGEDVVAQWEDVVAQWYDDIPLGEAMWSSVHAADHPTIMLQAFAILHVTPQARREEILDQFANAVRDG